MKKEKIFTKSFDEFSQCIIKTDWKEVYDFYDAAKNKESKTFFLVYETKGSTDMIIEHEPSGNCLRLSEKAINYLPEWIEIHMMDEMDSESYYGYHYQMDKD